MFKWKCLSEKPRMIYPGALIIRIDPKSVECVLILHCKKANWNDAWPFFKNDFLAVSKTGESDGGSRRGTNNALLRHAEKFWNIRCLGSCIVEFRFSERDVSSLFYTCHNISSVLPAVNCQSATSEAIWQFTISWISFQHFSDEFQFSIPVSVWMDFQTPFTI